MKAYYGSRIGPNRTKTPEGFLICHNTPIGRTGTQDYLPSELGLQGSDFVKLERNEADVFDPVSMASFEGKPVVDDHPPADVTPENAGNYIRGTTTNVRRGSGEEADLLLADLIVYDAILISEIEAGKREVSCGYAYDLEQMEGGGCRQKNIRGNHVAIVRNGRAGPRVQVKDEMPSEPHKKEGGKKMAKIDKKVIMGNMIKTYAKDAAPEEVTEAAKMINQLDEETTPPEATPVPPAAQPPTKDEDPGAGALQEIMGAIKALQADIAALKAGSAADEEPPKDALDELEAELCKDADPGSEETKTLSDDAPISEPSSRPENPIPGADSNAAILAALKAVRPVVAGIQDPVERKKAADMMAKSFREQLKVQPTNNYRKMTQPAQPKKAQDNAIDERELGRTWAKKWNPHYKNRD